MTQGVRLLLCLLLAVAAGSAALAQTAFYDAYDLGLKAEKESRWEEARNHFQSAVALRSTPGRRVKTYGLNFLDLYDPYLHLGRANLQLGRLDEAGQNLAKSRAAGVAPESELSTLERQLEQKRSRPLSTPTSAPVAVPIAPKPTQVVVVVPKATALAVHVEALPTAPRPAATLVAEKAPAPVSTRPERSVIAATPARETTATVTAPGPTVGPISTEPLPSRTEPASPVPLATQVPPPAAGGISAPLAAGIAVAALSILALAIVAFKRRSSTQETTPQASPGTPVGTIRQTPDSLIVKTTTLMAGTATGLKVATSSGGAEFGNYRLDRIIGQGGMGTTFLARRTRDDFPVVVKVPHDHLLAKPEFVNRFLLEGSLGATLHHPGIIRVYEAGEYQGCPFIAMELVEGTPLEKVLENGQRLPLRRALEVTRDLALALDYAHMKGVVHRDLKPDNIMILPTGHAKLMDYGIARLLGSEGLTATGIYVGTPLYSAPESLRPGEVDTQSDLYSLGIILYRMLSGTLPFVSSNPLEVLRQHSSEPLPPFPPETEPPDDVRLLVERLTAKRKEDRYKTAELFLRDLDVILNKGTG